MGKHQGRLGGGGSGEKMWVGASVVVSQGITGEAGLAGLGLAGLDNFMGCGAWGLSRVIWCLVLGWLGQGDSGPE